MIFEEEYRKIIEQLKKNEDYAVMRTICENIIGLLKENGVKVDGVVLRDITSTETMRVVNGFEVQFRGLDFTEHDKIYKDEISELKKILDERAGSWGKHGLNFMEICNMEDTIKNQKKQISELESELETAEKAFNHIRDCSKRQFDKNEKQEKEIKNWRDEAQKQSWRVSELDRALCVKGDLLKKANARISELESELSVKEDLLKIKNGLCNEESVIKILKSTPFVEDALEEEPLPFSSDEYEEVFLEELRSRDLNFNLVSKMLDVVELMLTDTQS